MSDMHRFKVIDPQGVYEDQFVEVPFAIDVTKQAQYVVMANYATVLMIAIERMYGSPIGTIDVAHVRDMFEGLELSDYDHSFDDND